MQVKAEGLADFLQSSDNLAKNCIVVYGQELFLAEEAANHIYQYAKQQGFTERDVFYIAGRDNFNKVAESLSSLSLFASKKVVEVRLESEKLNKAQSEGLLKLIPQIGNNILLIQASNLSFQVQKEAWFKTLLANSLAIVVSRVGTAQFPNWIANRAKQQGLQVNSEAVRIIVEYAEGNLLWAHQIISQLVILCEDKVIDVELLRSVFVDNSIFQINDLSRLILTKSKQLYKVTHKLQAENISNVLVASVLINDITVLSLLLSNKIPAQEAFKQYRIWPSKQKEYLAAQKHYNKEKIQALLVKLALLDKINKGASKGDAWLLIHQIVFELCAE